MRALTFPVKVPSEIRIATCYNGRKKERLCKEKIQIVEKKGFIDLEDYSI